MQLQPIKPITTITIVKAVIRVFFMGYMYLAFIYILVIQFSIHVAGQNPWGINDDFGASFLMDMMAAMALMSFYMLAIVDQE